MLAIFGAQSMNASAVSAKDWWNWRLGLRRWCHEVVDANHVWYESTWLMLGNDPHDKWSMIVNGK